MTCCGGAPPNDDGVKAFRRVTMGEMLQAAEQAQERALWADYETEELDAANAGCGASSPCCTGLCGASRSWDSETTNDPPQPFRRRPCPPRESRPSGKGALVSVAFRVRTC